MPQLNLRDIFSCNKGGLFAILGSRIVIYRYTRARARDVATLLVHYGKTQKVEGQQEHKMIGTTELSEHPLTREFLSR